MAHLEQRGFFEIASRQLIDLGHNLETFRVLEIGSLDVNGSIRPLFDKAEQYIGVDLVPGKSVDFVGHASSLPNELGKFELVLSAEVLEHDRNWKATLKRAYEMLSGEGLFIISCASTGRPEHGTPRTDPTQSPGTSAKQDWYYRNLRKSEVEKELESLGMTLLASVYNPLSFDYYCIASKSSYSSIDCSSLRAQIESSIANSLRGLSSPSKMFLRAPIYLVNILLGVQHPKIVDAFANVYWWPIRVVSKLVGDKVARKT